MHVASQKEAEANNVTLHDLIKDMNQRFIRLVLGSSKGCRTPLLLYYDDYIGNEQKEIVATKAFTGAMDILASYYGIGYISFADAVKTLFMVIQMRIGYHQMVGQNDKYTRGEECISRLLGLSFITFLILPRTSAILKRSIQSILMIYQA